MASTNKTTNINLSQFIATDKPTFLQDYNGDMLKIDTAINERTKIIGINTVSKDISATSGTYYYLGQTVSGTISGTANVTLTHCSGTVTVSGNNAKINAFACPNLVINGLTESNFLNIWRDGTTSVVYQPKFFNATTNSDMSSNYTQYALFTAKRSINKLILFSVYGTCRIEGTTSINQLVTDYPNTNMYINHPKHFSSKTFTNVEDNMYIMSPVSGQIAGFKDLSTYRYIATKTPYSAPITLYLNYNSQNIGIANTSQIDLSATMLSISLNINFGGYINE